MRGTVIFWTRLKTLSFLFLFYQKVAIQHRLINVFLFLFLKLTGCHPYSLIFSPFSLLSNTGVRARLGAQHRFEPPALLGFVSHQPGSISWQDKTRSVLRSSSLQSSILRFPLCAQALAGSKVFFLCCTEHRKGSSECYLLLQNTACRFSSYKTTLKQQLNSEKWDAGYLSAFGWAVSLRSFWCPLRWSTGASQNFARTTCTRVRLLCMLNLGFLDCKIWATVCDSGLCCGIHVPFFRH